MSTKPWTGGEGPTQPGPAGLLELFRRRGQRRHELAPPAAVLFDLDGLLVDSEPLWTIAEHKVAGSLGGTFTPELKERMIGKRLDLAVGVLLDGLDTRQARTADPHTVGQELMAHTAALFAEGVPLQPGAEQLLDALAAAHVPLGLVSSSYRQLVDAALVGVGAHRFAVSVAGDEVAHGKPNPEPYLTAAKGLGVVPARCVVLEDARAGLDSAIAAGCACVYVPTFPADKQDPDSTAGEPLPPRAVQRPSLLEVDLRLLSELSVHPGSEKHPGSPAA
ncbi:MAG TPA: HAD family phosphatase [Frankiaceae bacterium]|nr:HAD family phosphatase [Frankiaceae bacterium]